VIGYDVNAPRVEELRQGHDRTRELSGEELQQALAAGLELSTNPADLAAADVFIVTVPTPIDGAKRPELTPLRLASAAVGEAIRARAQRQHETQAVEIPGSGDPRQWRSQAVEIPGSGDPRQW
jgi:UDP-N-acetyl-D-glucosamine/UDP-N-acetyl-D-galactosamine dehydrogenase